MPSRIRILFFLPLAVVLGACSGSGGGGGSINPDNPNEVSKGISVAVNGIPAERKTGDPPAATTSGNEPIITKLPGRITVSSGETVSLQPEVESNSGITQLFSKVAGADDFFEVSLAQSKVTTMLDIEIAIPDNILDGEFCQSFAVSDGEGLTSERGTVCFQVDSSTPAPPGDTTDPDSAAACFNQELWAVGTQLRKTTKNTETFGTDTFTETEEAIIDNLEATTYRGQQAQQFSETDPDPDPNVASDIEYFQIDNQTPMITYLGIVVEFTDGSREETYFEPGLILRFDLQPGESFSQTVTETAVFDGQEFPSSYDSTITYMGRSTVTIDAGTFETCHFIAEQTADFDGDGTAETATSEFYVGVGNGLELLYEQTFDGGSIREEFVSATINGTSI